MVRSTSDTRAIDHLNVERVIGDVTDTGAIASALEGCHSVFYCIVDTRAWLRDPAPLYQTNVEGLRTVMDVARGRMSFYWDGGGPVVGIRDAA